jgi:2,4-dienoyl-CoA reductase-like NADH-dependent reductase (Old Yellow Enzyme family)
MAKLFEKTSIGALDLLNRSIRSATWSGLGDSRGYVTDAAIDFYRRLGGGGIGLIITGYQYVLPNGIQLPYMIGNYEDEQTEGLSKIAQAVHEQGGKVVPQIVHAGARANPKLFINDEEVWAPSAIPDPQTEQVPHELSKQQILNLIDAYAAAAARSLKAGFDGVQLHGAHGYGINQFLSPIWNKRNDAYGGDLKKRYRFLGELIEAVRGAVGNDFPLMIKLTAHDFVEGGFGPSDSVEIARRLADDGIDAIEVSGGNAASPSNLGPVRGKIKSEEDEAYFAEFAEKIKQSVKIPIITVGGIRSVSTIDKILADGKADYISMSRPFIREPHLINRWKSGDTRKSSCMSCGGCFETGVKGMGISCKIEREKGNKEAKKNE